MFFIASILGALILNIQAFLDRHIGLATFFRTLWLFLQGESSFAELIGSTGSPALATVLFFLKIVSFGFSAALVYLIFSTRIKYKMALEKLMEPTKPPAEISYNIVNESEKLVNPKWEKVLEHINSPNHSDWRLAILEADIMLGEVLDKMGYLGATIGDKLKSIEQSDFTNLQAAWEAHKVRNMIAHEGSDFNLNKPEAERVIKLFEKVFKEFKFI